MPKSLVSAPSGLVPQDVMRNRFFPDNPDFMKPYTLRDLCKKRQFPHLRIGKKLYFNLDEVQAYLEKNDVRVS
jgi:Helix-turn-helix domain